MTANELFPLVAKMRIPAAALYVVPSVIDRFAKAAKMSQKQMLAELLKNEEAREYAEQITIQVYKEMKAQK